MTPVPRRAAPAHEALAVVGLTVGEVASCVDREHVEGARYLVGSLASGLGNAHSDVDVHVLVPGLAHAVGPRLYHAAETTVDVEQYPLGWAGETLGRLSAVPTAERPFGTVALRNCVAGSQRRWLCRWIHAAPLEPTVHPVFSDDETRALLPALVREAHDRVLIEVAAGLLADAAADRATRPQPTPTPTPTPTQTQTPSSEYLWMRAARGLLELRCRAAGDVTTGEKWLPARARRLGLSAPEPRAGLQSHVLSSLGWNPADVLTAVRIAPAGDAASADLAGRRFLINRHDRALESWIAPQGSLAEALKEHAPEDLLAAVRNAACDLVLDEEFIDGRLAA